MALPTYDKTKRKSHGFDQLPKGAYVLKILNAKEAPYKSGSGSCLSIAFDIAEGEYKDFYKKQFDANTGEDKKWPNDAIFRLGIPDDSAPSWKWDGWNNFFADLEDSNNGYVFAGDPATLKGKVIGGKFHIEQSEYNGNVYDHTRLKWSCVAEDVRKGKAGKLPNDKLIGSGSARRATNNMTDADGFMKVPDSNEEEIPFD